MKPNQDNIDCMQLLEDAFGDVVADRKIHYDETHVKVSIRVEQFANYDPDYLTRLIVLSHDRRIHFKLGMGGAGKISITLSKREHRSGLVHEMIPTMERAMLNVREYGA